MWGCALLDLSGWPQVHLVTIQHNGKTYAREGECCRCGECCLKWGATYWRDEHGCTRLHFETNELGAKRACCDVYWDRPTSCSLYPFEPSDELTPHCTFRWVEVTDGR